MNKSLFIAQTTMPAPVEELFAWHARPGAFERLLPPWEAMRLIERSGGIGDGARTLLEVPMGPLRRQWLAEHRDYIENRQFRDVQTRGPMAFWEHTHLFHSDGLDRSILEDRIEYALPLGFLGRMLGGGMVRRKLSRTFAYRHTITRNDLTLHRRRPPGLPWKLLVSGATGMVGSALAPFLTTGGHEVRRLTRGPRGVSATSSKPGDVAWDDITTSKDVSALEGLDAVVHLAGENIGDKRWTRARMDRIRESRVSLTRDLCKALKGLRHPPRTLVCASAVGFYGDRPGEVLDESSGPGQGFLAEVCRDWETAADAARAAGIRVVHLRFGVILAGGGGALKKMLTPFRLGLGGRIGSGTQFMPWICLDDVLGVIHHALVREDLSGPVNAVSPQAVTNREFTKTLGGVLGRPTIMPLPRFAARLAIGKMADEALLASANVAPRRLKETEYVFLFPTLEAALRHQLGSESIGRFD